MTDSLEQFLEDLRFEVPAGLAHRAQAAAAADVRAQQRIRMDMNLPRQPRAVALVAVLLALAIVATLVFGLRALRPKALVPGGKPTAALDVKQVTGRRTAANGSFFPNMMSGTVGWSGLLRTTDGGVTWLDVSPPAPDGTIRGRSGAGYFLDVNHAWMAAVIGPVPSQPTPVPLTTQVAVFATADGGQTWKYGPPLSVNLINATFLLDFVDAQNGWLIGDSGPYMVENNGVQSTITVPRVRDVYTTKDGGLHWTHLVHANEADSTTSGWLAVGCTMTDLKFTSLQRGWLVWDCNRLVGPSSAQQSTGLLASTNDGGRTWQAAELPLFPAARDAGCAMGAPVFTGNHGVLVVGCLGFRAMYQTNDSGRSWTFMQPPFARVPSFVDANTGWIVSADGLYRTTNGGGEWVLVIRFASDKRFAGLKNFSVRFFDANLGYASTFRCPPAARTVWRTTDGGQTWSQISVKPGGYCN